jgi:uncharacterized protein
MAAGVAGGAFLFEGIENMMGHHDAALPDRDLAPQHATAEDLTINNYYGSDDRPETGNSQLVRDDPDDENDNGDFV